MKTLLKHNESSIWQFGNEIFLSVRDTKGDLVYGIKLHELLRDLDNAENAEQREKVLTETKIHA